MKEATSSPVFCAIYPELATLAREHGYALSIHGSLARDFDLVAIPWADEVQPPQSLVDAIVREFAFDQHGEPITKAHGRTCYSLLGRLGWVGHIDLSFVPSGTYTAEQQVSSVDSHLIIKFQTAEAQNHFKLWLCESGEQSYWDWMRVREEEEDGNITAVRFDYHFPNGSEIGVTEGRVSSEEED
jgi:hypothetical protein